MYTCRRAGPGYWGTDTLRGRSSFCSDLDRGCTGRGPADPLFPLLRKHTDTHTHFINTECSVHMLKASCAYTVLCKKDKDMKERKR